MAKTVNSKAVPLSTEPPESGGGITGWWQRVCQQKLAGWSPRPSAHTILGYYTVVSCLLLGLGGVQVSFHKRVQRVDIRYDNLLLPGQSCRDKYNAMLASNGEGIPAEVTFTVPSRMEAPVYVFYHLQSFVSGHKRFQRSRDNLQLSGNEDHMLNPVAACQPQAFLGSDTNGRNANLPNEGAITPCGLIGWSLFNDTFSLRNSSGRVQISDYDISWASDRKNLFGNVSAVNYNTDPSLRGGGTTYKNLSSSEHLIIWYRVASTPDIDYRWGTIDTDLEPGNYTLSVQNRFNTYDFCAQKIFILSTNTWVGSDHQVLSILYLVIGALFTMTLVMFLVAFLGAKRRAIGEASQLSWNRNETRALLHKEES
mmetsp:Transcript_8137/g.23357  ORF Transcript_8137/g.23357 Transcript_8137/m.23357 type:complete len:368 (-) Transcript_8137:256-1359(-)